MNASARMSGKKGKRKDGTMLKEEAATIAALQKKTSLSANEIKEQHKEFKKICPQGVVTSLPCFNHLFAWNPGFNNLCYDHYDLILSIFPDDKETISGKLR